MTYKTEGVILKYTDLGENSRLITIYTKDFGKINVQARAVKKSTSKLAGHLETLTLSRLVMARGKFLDIVIDALAINNFKGIRLSLKKTAAAFCIAELVDSLIGESQSDRQIYSLLVKALEFLNQKEPLKKERKVASSATRRRGGDELVVRFGLQLLVLLGFAPERAIHELPLQKTFNYYLSFAPEQNIQSEEFLNEVMGIGE